MGVNGTASRHITMSERHTRDAGDDRYPRHIMMSETARLAMNTLVVVCSETEY